MDDFVSGWQDWQAAFDDKCDVSISELHGLMTGVLTVCDAPTAAVWQALLVELGFSELDASAIELLTEEAEDVAAQLMDGEERYQFSPLLPDDEHALNERLMALKDWANGFMTGFGVTDSALRPDERGLFGDLAKVGALAVTVTEAAAFEDWTDDNADDEDGWHATAAFNDIGDNGADDTTEDTDDELAGLDDNARMELAYMELLEFVRMVPVSVTQGRVRKAVDKLPLLAGFAVDRPIGLQGGHSQQANVDAMADWLPDDDEQDWQAQKDANDARIAKLAYDATVGKRPS
ncbi:UPF0149 family protein [Moraxella atlantae]|uniref:UPF0149 family protein n=1 Tax=Faucicola atlantae TaxID=34059 RepID=UPI003751BB2A